MTVYQQVENRLQAAPRTWLVTGVAGFIGSNFLEELLKLDQRAIGLDNFSTGKKRNLEEVQSRVNAEQWSRFVFIDADIRDLESCRKACQNVDFVLHQAALGSVPRSIEDPITANQVNVTGFLNMLIAARDQKLRRFVYAASSATYGDHPGLPKVENEIGAAFPLRRDQERQRALRRSVWTLLRRNALDCAISTFSVASRPGGCLCSSDPRWIAAMMRNHPPSSTETVTRAAIFVSWRMRCSEHPGCHGGESRRGWAGL